MKKRLIVVLAVLATVVGMAFAYTYKYTLVTNYECGHEASRTTETTTDPNMSGKTLVSPTKKRGKCETCKLQDEIAKQKRATENVCNVLKGSDYDTWSKTSDCQ